MLRNPSQVRAKIGRMRYALSVLEDGLDGKPRTLGEADGESVQRHLEAVGVVLVSRTKLTKLGYRLKRGAGPLMKRYYGAPLRRHAELYDLASQCVPLVRAPAKKGLFR